MIRQRNRQFSGPGNTVTAMGTSIRLGKVLGIPIGINYSWLVIFGLIIFLLSSQFAELYPQWPLPQRWATAAIATLLFFLSVLAHELSHSLVAVRRGIPVRGITLFIFGGVSQLAHEAQRPWTEFLVAIVGPLTSLLLAALLGGLWYWSDGASSYLRAVLFTLFAVNLSLGIFNLLPGFPLDGGRVLRAVVWGISGSYWRATQAAVRAGQGLGLLIIGAGILWWFRLGDFQGVWFGLVGGFLFYMATSSYRQEELRESLKAYRVEDAMTPGTAALPGELPAAAPTTLQTLARNGGLVGVLVEGKVQGVVTAQQLARQPRANWQAATLAQLMTPWAARPPLAAADSVFDALEQLAAAEQDWAPVMREGRPVGLVSRGDLARFVDVYAPSRRRWRPW